MTSSFRYLYKRLFVLFVLFVSCLQHHLELVHTFVYSITAESSHCLDMPGVAGVPGLESMGGTGVREHGGYRG